jgi:hypothetical protein
MKWTSLPTRIDAQACRGNGEPSRLPAKVLLSILLASLDKDTLSTIGANEVCRATEYEPWLAFQPSGQ